MSKLDIKHNITLSGEDAEVAMAHVPHILIVEDNPQDVDLLMLSFKPYLHRLNIVWVPNTISALDYLAKRGHYVDAATPDLILLDLNLPVQSGDIVLIAVKNDPTWSRIPVMVLSSSCLAQDVEAAYNNGALLYIVKPNHWDRWIDLGATFARFVGLQVDRKESPPPGAIPSTRV